jgi:putative ABC transport system substrate-binding protein
MKRRAFVSIFGGAAVLASQLLVRAQPAPKVPRLGYLAVGLPSPSRAFLQAMHDLGYVEGQNVLVEYRGAEGKPDRLPEMAAELIRLKVDVVFASGTQATFAAKGAVVTTPVVFSVHADPVEAGFVSSLGRPGGMLSGVTLMAPELVGKRLQLLREIVPAASHIAVLVNIANPGMQSTLTRLQEVARTLETKLQIFDARDGNEVERSIAAMPAGRANALYVSLDPLFVEHRVRIVELAATKRLPALYDISDFVQAGGLMSYGPRLADVARRAAVFVDKVIKGAKPAELPVEQPTRFELVVNLKTAKALELAIPQSLLLRADEVIQ